MRITLLLIALITLVSCGTPHSSTLSVLDFEKREWNIDEWVEFDFRQTDTINPHRIDFLIRHTPNIKWQAMQLEVRTINPAKKFWCDTIIVRFTDNNEKWLGRERSTHIDLDLEYRNSVRFNRSGNYNIRIRRLNPDTSAVEGIKAIGLKIETDGKK